jgi:DNA processing protein
VSKRSSANLPPAHLLYPEHPEWPREAFAGLSKAPAWLEIAGSLPDLSRSVAIVGTRFCDPWAASFTRGLAAELARAGVTIVSGGALGIDTAAHEGALEAGGPTIVILPTGTAKPYPAENRALFNRIVAHGGCLLSEGGKGGPALPHTFLDRNRIIAALGQVAVVTQAPPKSGALSTAAHARGLGRPVLAVPSAPWDARGGGGLLLLEQGARICRTSADVLSLVARGASGAPAPKRTKLLKSEEHQQLDPDQLIIANALDVGEKGADELCDEVGLAAPRVHRAVLMLLLSGAIREVGSGRYTRADDS